MVNYYHSTVEEGIVLLGKEWKKNKKVRKVFRGIKHPISLVDANSKLVMNYEPDVYFVLRNNKKVIFEVLDSEQNKQDIIVADVIRSILTENVHSIIFVYHGDTKDERRILEALVTISKGLINKLGVKESEIPFGKSGPILIRKENAKTAEMVKDIMAEKLTPYL